MKEVVSVNVRSPFSGVVLSCIHLLQETAKNTRNPRNRKKLKHPVLDFPQLVKRIFRSTLRIKKQRNERDHLHQLNWNNLQVMISLLVMSLIRQIMKNRNVKKKKQRKRKRIKEHLLK